MTMSQLEALPIVIEGHSFICHDQRMWNLNEIHRVLGLPASKMPSEWNNKIRTQLDRSGNFRTVNGDGGGTWATEAGAVAYAMWVSTDFYLMVINAFIFMRNDAIVRERVAVKQADEANANLSIAAPKADIFDGRLTNGGSVPWNWACKSLGLAPMKLKEGLKRSGKFVQKWNPDSYADELRPQEKAFSIGLFVTKSVMGKDTWQVTAKGYAWMQGNAQKWRELIADGDRLKAAERRAQKRLNRGGK